MFRLFRLFRVMVLFAGLLTLLFGSLVAASASAPDQWAWDGWPFTPCVHSYLYSPLVVCVYHGPNAPWTPQTEWEPAIPMTATFLPFIGK